MASLKSITREYGSGVYVTNETKLSGSDLVFFDKVIINIHGSKDVYYFNMADGRMFVYRAKLSKIVNGCLFVRDRDEYTAIYHIVLMQGYANMPENIFVKLDREWEQTKALR